MLLFKTISFTFTIFVGAVLFSACDTKTEHPPIKQEIKPIAVNVHTLKKEAYPIWVAFSGKTQAVDEVMVKSRVLGELEKQLFKAGDTVKKGQVLFTIDKREYEAIWEQKNAILQKDKASLALAIANVKRYAPLVAESLAPKEKLDELEATQKQLEATIKSDKASLKTATLNLDYCDVRASIDGQIGKALILVGNIVTEGVQLAQIVQTDFLYVNLNPSASEVSLIKKYKSKPNPKVKVQLKSTKNLKVSLEGEIDFIDNVSNASTGTVVMRAKIDNHEKLLFPGSFVELQLFVSDEIPVLALDPDQLLQNQQGQYVLVVNTQNEIVTQQVTTSYSNNDLVIIAGGIKEGDKIIVGSIKALRNGIKVVPTEVNNPISEVK